MPIMKTEYKTPETVAEIGAVFLSLTPVRDPMLKSRLAFWTARFGDKPLAELSPDDIDAALAELETVPSKTGKFKSGPTVNRYRMALQSAIRFAKQKRLLPRGWVPQETFRSTRKTRQVRLTLRKSNA
jgi:hypothetical protein